MASDSDNFDIDEESLDASPFGQFLFSQREGLTHAELSQALAEVSEAVLANGGKGTITLKITVSPLGHENRLVVKDEVIVKTPKPIRESSIWFFNERQRGLSRRDPHQGELDLAVIPMRPRTGAAIATERPSA
jgi:hypothetical protein